MKKNAKYALMYAKDLSIPPNAEQKNTEIVEFRTLIGLLWFLVWNKVARRALSAGRVLPIRIKKDSPAKEV